MFRIKTRVCLKYFVNGCSLNNKVNNSSKPADKTAYNTDKFSR